MKKILFIIGVCLAAASLLVSQSSAEKLSWKIGHVRPAGSAIDNDIAEFTKAISEATKGEITFSTYPANKLGDYSVVQERVSFGEVEMYVGPFGTAVDKRLMLAFPPFLVDTWEDAQKLYAASSPLIKHLQDFLEPQNIKIIGGWPVYFGGVALTQTPPAPGDPAVSKDMIIRVPPIKSFELTGKALGYTPYPITWMYAKMGLKTGMVKGIIGGGAEGYKGLSNLISYYIPLKDHFEYWFVYMNLDVWKTLSEDQQGIITKSAAQMESKRYEVGEQAERENTEKLRELGVEVYEPSAEELSKMKSKVRQEVWPVLREAIGPPFDEIVKYVETGT